MCIYSLSFVYLYCKCTVSVSGCCIAECHSPSTVYRIQYTEYNVQNTEIESIDTQDVYALTHIRYELALSHSRSPGTTTLLHRTALSRLLLAVGASSPPGSRHRNTSCYWCVSPHMCLPHGASPAGWILARRHTVRNTAVHAMSISS